MYKIEIKGTPEDIQRISIFLDNNHLKHSIKDDVSSSPSVLEEISEAIDWPLY